MSKNILITGASSGIGRAIAEHFINKGFNVIGTSREPNQTDSTVPLYQLNIMDEVTVNKVVQQFVQKFGTIDVLINNAGYALAGPIEETTIKEAKEQLDVNFFGAVRMIQAVLPKMRANGGGLIINISSIGGLIGMPYQAFYSASKFALEGLVEALRIEVKKYNIKIININPGDFKTSCHENRLFAKGITNLYEKDFNTVLDKCIHDEKNGSNPQMIARLVEKLINKSTAYKVRYSIGRFDQRLAAWLKNKLGSRIFEKIVASAFRQ